MAGWGGNSEKIVGGKSHRAELGHEPMDATGLTMSCPGTIYNSIL